MMRLFISILLAALNTFSARHVKPVSMPSMPDSRRRLSAYYNNIIYFCTELYLVARDDRIEVIAEAISREFLKSHRFAAARLRRQRRLHGALPLSA